MTSGVRSTLLACVSLLGVSFEAQASPVCTKQADALIISEEAAAEGNASCQLACTWNDDVGNATTSTCSVDVDTGQKIECSVKVSRFQSVLSSSVSCGGSGPKVELQGASRQ